MGIVTSSRRLHFETIHEKSGLLPYMDFVLTREDYVESKPHPEPYLAAAALLGVDPTRCLVLEDAPSGGAAARATVC